MMKIVSLKGFVHGIPQNLVMVVVFFSLASLIIVEVDLYFILLINRRPEQAASGRVHNRELRSLALRTYMYNVHETQMDSLAMWVPMC